MSDFRQVATNFWASPQIGLDDLAAAVALGCTTVINNRPEGESDDQVSGAEVAAAAESLGLAYVAIPVTHAGFSQAQVEAMIEALTAAKGPVLAYCRSGTRSTLLWSLAQAHMGRDLDEVARAAAGAGYDVQPIRPLMDMLAASRSA